MCDVKLKTDPPMVRLGCARCYLESGNPTSCWFEAEGADALTAEDIHRGQHRVHDDCRVIWVCETKGIPVESATTVDDVARWGEIHAEVEEHLWPALCAWIRSGDYIAEADTDFPALADFRERYAGEWGSFDDFAYQLAEDINLLDGTPEVARKYFNWRSWVRDLRPEYSVLPAPNHAVYVFRSL